MAVPASQSSLHRSLSVGLCNILDNLGASEEMRQVRRETGTTREILGTLASRFIGDTAISDYTFGSSIEGTTIPGLHSDLDKLFVFEEWQVIQDVTEPHRKAKYLLLLVKDENTKPGYCKLQVLSKGVPQTSDHVNMTDEFGTTYKLDQKNRIVACKRQLKGIQAESHGPADTSLPKVLRPATDMVQGYRCQSWPAIAEQWLSRKRHYNWPTQAMIDEAKSLGFFVVPVGHPNSSERDKEWRISLSLQERLLMFHLNPTQHKCFILLKLIKNEILLHLVGEASISSYHCKTCILYTIENTPSKLWATENLLSCLQCCLLCLLGWTINWCCPNYFIPEENMFEGRMDSRIQEKLIAAFKKLLLADFTYLALIKCDSFGERLQEIFINRPEIWTLAQHQLQAEQVVQMYCSEKFAEEMTFYQSAVTRLLFCVSSIF